MNIRKKPSSTGSSTTQSCSFPAVQAVQIARSNKKVGSWELGTEAPAKQMDWRPFEPQGNDSHSGFLGMVWILWWQEDVLKLIIPKNGLVCFPGCEILAQPHLKRTSCSVFVSMKNTQWIHDRITTKSIHATPSYSARFEAPQSLRQVGHVLKWVNNIHF